MNRRQPSGSSARKTKQRRAGEFEFGHEVLSQIIQIASDAIISVDYAGRIRLFNYGAEQIFGYGAQEIIGETLDILIPEEFRGGHRNKRQRFAEEGPSSRHMNQRQDIFGLRKDGSRFPARASISCVAAGDDTIFTVYLRDLSKVRQAEEDIRQARDQIAHLGRTSMLGEISTSLAHEINQPLAAILANSQALRRRINVHSASSAVVDEIISDIISDVKRAGAVIEQLRAHVRPGTHEFEVLDINQVVAEAEALMHSEIIMQRVACELDLAPGLPAVFGSRIQLQQVLLNCLSNSLDAMAQRESHERVLILSTHVAGLKYVEIIVKDSGVGFKEQTTKQLFEPFYTTKDRGIGMGLNISRSIVRAHGGRFWAESKGVSGATFYVTLPAVEAEAELEAPAEAGAGAEIRVDDRDPMELPVGEPSAPATVFIVDDDLSFCTAMARLVQAAGYAVEIFTSAQEFLQRKPFDGNACLVVDLHMPGKTGLDLQAKLGTRDYVPPIIFLTGAGDTQSGVSAMKLGAIDFLSKPIDEEELLQVIARGVECDRQGRDRHARRSAAIRKLARLTKRECEIMDLVVSGLPNKRIANTLGISEKTVKAHRGRVMHKTKAGSVAGLVRMSELAADTLQSERG